MSFSRLPYDECSYKHYLKETTSTGDYMINVPRNDCDGCFFPSPHIRMSRYGNAVCTKEAIDVDSELMGLTRKQSRCPKEKYIPSEKEMCVKSFPRECRGLDPEETRISNPPCTLRGTGWNRWEWLCQNPQDKAIVPFEFAINNRLVVKDNHRPCVPKPIDPNSALPAPTSYDPTCMFSMYKPDGTQRFPPRDERPSIHWRDCSEIQRY
jgi:hypothetical protein